MMAGAQADLAGIPPAPVQTPAPVGTAPLLKVVGVLAEPAQVIDPTHGRPLRLQVLVAQTLEHHPHALPVLARMPAPEWFSSYAEARAWADFHARRLTAGTEVIVLGRGLETGTWCHAPVFRLLDVAAIRRLEDEPAFSSPNGATHAQ